MSKGTTIMAAKQQESQEERVERFGRIDNIGRQVTGWAIDLRQDVNEPAVLMLWGDDQPLGLFRCTDPRPDVNAHGYPGALPGFRLDLPDSMLDGKPHCLSIRFRSGEALPYFGKPDEPQETFTFLHQVTTVQGMVDGMAGAFVRGWAFRTDLRTGEKTGGVTLEAWSNGIKIGQVKADQPRNDVAEAFGCQPHCGFRFPLPSRFRNGVPFVLEFRPAPEGGQIGGSPFSGSLLARESLDQLHTVLDQVETLSTQIFSLKEQLRRLLMADEYSLESYHNWAVSYFEVLRTRMAAERRSARYAELLDGQDIKVSILCPTYKPNLAEFAQAVESVRRQSWHNWELVIVDDGSRSPALSEMIAQLAAEEPRIRVVTLAKNSGISGATNAAIEAATGDWIALFDHDDMLVDVAIEAMLLAARNTGARVLYSDEDKIDSFGMYSDPHLKTDFNYRLLLTNNYVCHLLMVEAATLRAAGPMNPAYDGAQDHDLMLRLAETVPAAQIHHVPEILYHWRKTAGSTASQASAKPYAIQAGVNAVQHHLDRKGLPAKVTAPAQATVYDVRWKFAGEPKVTIVIPFKDKVDLTRRCVECLLKVTAYRNYEVILIDNWSTEPETLSWLDSLAGEKRVRVLRVEEAFNFSRLNNRAVQKTDSELLLFMNNDIFVEQPDWLRMMVDEAVADPAVGVVGVKLVYPNRSVQHAGVVLGVGGVGDHAFRGLAEDAPGYMGRAVSAHDVSVVTAACMLCRADAFRAVGGFDEENLTVAFNDVDLCLKIGRAGYRVVFTPAVVAEHHESISRGSDLSAHNLPRFYAENQFMMDRWGALFAADPYYNPHFSREEGIFQMLSSASLDSARAPSLLHRPVPRATLETLSPLTHPSAEPAPEAAPARKPKAEPKPKAAPARSRKRQPVAAQA